MLDWLAECFETEMGNEQGATIAALLRSAKADVISKQRVASGIDEHMPEAWPEYVDLEKALLKGDLRSAKEIFDKRTAEGNSLLELELHLVQPALYHLATSTAITLMAQEFTRTKRGVPNGKKVICACVKGNNHAVGIRIVADAFELNGWEVLFLGKDVSSQDLIERTRAFEPHLICLSVSIAEHLQVAKSTIKSLHMTFAEKVPAIMLGGLAVNAHTPLAQVVGADLFAPDAKKALEESK
jgi:methanogenic corrinoid protein MtbC1